MKLAIRVVATVGLALSAFWFGDTRSWEAFFAAIGLLIVYLGAETTGLGRDRYRAADRQLFREFGEVLPFIGAIEMLRDQDFHVAFNWSTLNPLKSFTRSWNDAAHRFHDSKLQERADSLRRTANRFLNELALNTFPAPQDWLQEISRDWSHDKQVIVGDQLNTSAEAVVAEYEAFVEAARKSLNV